jgi:hypothetical protein
MKGRLHGIIWGTAFGLFLDSIMLVATSAWLLFAIWPLLVPVVIGAIVGALLCQARMISFTPRTVILRLFAIIMLWSVSIASPIISRWIQLHLEAQTLPICTGCQIETMNITVLAFDNTPGYEMMLRCDRPPSECIEFYRQELPKLGWSAPIEHRFNNSVSYEFTKYHRSLQISDVSKEDYIAGSNQLMRFQRVAIGCVAANYSYH